MSSHENLDPEKAINGDVPPAVAFPESSTDPVNKVPNNNVSEIAGSSGASTSSNKVIAIHESYFRTRYLSYEKLHQRLSQVLLNCASESSSLDDASRTNHKRACPTVPKEGSELYSKQIKFMSLDSAFKLLENATNDFAQMSKLPFPCASSSSITCGKENLNEKNYFEELPILIVQNIFLRLPFSDLMKARTVCKSWDEIISNSKFLEWKKTYYQMKLEHGDSSNGEKVKSYFDIATSVVTDYNEITGETVTFTVGGITLSSCFSSLISFMHNKFTRNPPADLENFLDDIPSCITAKHLLLERFSEKPLLCSNPWCILAVTVLLSSTVEGLYDVFHRLFNVHYCDCNNILEAMFCIAAILLHLIRKFAINSGPYYRLYNVIYLLENTIPFDNAVFSVQPKMKLLEQRNPQNDSQLLELKLTHEQTQILNHKLAPRDIIRISSFAGTGKTTTLMQFAKKYANLKFLYLPSKQPSCDYIASRSPPNVVCTTLESMAYEAVGKWYEHKLTDKLNVDDILPFVHRWASFFSLRRLYAASVFKTIETFIQSKHDCISEFHVQCSNPNLQEVLVLFNQSDSNSFDRLSLIRSMILLESKEVWNIMVSKDTTCKISPSVYLKLYQLSKPRLSNYDCIMIDEAEDFVEVMLSIVLSQDTASILAGDPNQQVVQHMKYTLRTWTDVNATHSYRLTKSFRFGPEIAYLTQCCLKTLGTYPKSTIVGSLKESYVDGTIKGQYAIISHTTKDLFMEVIRLCCSSEREPHEPMDFRGAFVGGMPIAYMDQLIDIYKLSRDEPGIKDEFIKKFRNLSWLEMHVRTKKDIELRGKVEIVHSYMNSSIMAIINTIKRKCSYNVANADIVFSTTHNAKGLEFDTVRLVGQFISNKVSNFSYFLSRLVNRNSEMEELVFYDLEAMGQADRHNNLYFGFTRAKTCLILPEDAFFALLFCQEEFEYPVPSTTFENAGYLKCAACLNTFIPSTVLTMLCRGITLTSGRYIKDGPLCVDCAVKPSYPHNLNRWGKMLPPIHIDDYYHVSMAGFMCQLPAN